MAEGRAAGLAGRRRGPSPPHAISLGRARACMHGVGPATGGRSQGLTETQRKVRVICHRRLA
jgi:hypothetical protein